MKSIQMVLATGVAALLGWAGAASAQTTWSFDFTGANWDSAAWHLNGNSRWANDNLQTPTHWLRLTDNGADQSGTAWFHTQIAVKESWSISATGRISDPVGDGAEGWALVLQTHGLNALANSGDLNPFQPGGHPFGTDFLCINLDTYPNDGETSVNSIELLTRMDVGVRDLDGGELQGSFSFGLNVSYDADAKQLVYTFQRDGFSAVTVTRTSWDIADRFPDNDYAYVGFWGGTGPEVMQNHDVHGITITGIPEPATGGILAVAGLMVLALRRRR